MQGDSRHRPHPHVHVARPCFPFGDRRRRKGRATSITRLAEEHERAFFVADDDVGRLVMVQVGGGNLRTDSGIVVDLVRDKTYVTIGVPLQLKPVDNGWRVGFFVDACLPLPVIFHRGGP